MVNIPSFYTEPKKINSVIEESPLSIRKKVSEFHLSNTFSYRIIVSI